MATKNQSQKQPRQAKDNAVYVRKQQGHSAIIGWLIIGPCTLFILPIYWTVSPNHYWHA